MADHCYELVHGNNRSKPHSNFCRFSTFALGNGSRTARTPMSRPRIPNDDDDDDGAGEVLPQPFRFIGGLPSSSSSSSFTTHTTDGLVNIVIDRAWRVLVEQARVAALAAPSLHAVATINLPFKTDFIIPTSGNKFVRVCSCVYRAMLTPLSLTRSLTHTALF